MKKKKSKNTTEREKELYYLLQVPKIAELLFPIFLKIHKLRKNDTGIFYYLYYKKTNHLNGGNIGNIPQGKHSEYTDLCHEKLQRIFNNRELTSLQSADHAKKQYEGAIQVNDNLYLSIHGLPKGLNQEFALMIAVAARELDSRMYSAIQLLSQKKT